MSNLLSHQVYIFPYQHRYGSEWELNFWDALYYLAAHRGLPIRVTARTICTLMNGGQPDAARFTTLRHHFMRYWQQATQAGWLIECTPDHHKAAKADTNELQLTFRGKHRVYCFLLPHYPPTQNYFFKPRGYITRGWINLVSGSYPKRLLNFLLSHPGLKVQGDSQILPMSELIREFRQELRRTASLSTHHGRVQEAFYFLQRLGLIDCFQENCRLNWETFLLPPPFSNNNIATGELVYQADWLTAQVQDPPRAKLALEILQQGGWTFSKFWRIYSDLDQLGQTQVATIQHQLATWHNRTGRTLGWTGLLNRAAYRPQSDHPQLVKSKVVRLNFSTTAEWHVPLPLETNIIEDVSLWHTQELVQARVVVSLLPPPRTAEIDSAVSVSQVTLWATLTQAQGQPLTSTTRWPVVIEHFTEYRCLDITAQLKATLELADLWLLLQLDRPQANLQAQAWLELKTRPIGDKTDQLP